MAFDPKRTAVVLIEYQNDFTSEGGALHGAVQGVMEQTGMLENTRKLVEAARAAGATIVYAPITFAPGCVESTMRTGYEKGYQVITLSDCVAATSAEEHANAIQFDYPMFSEVMASDAFTAELTGKVASAAG